MPKVAVLPEYIASQIAAGEVVERPSSVIKELVENSLDAGATRIEISVSPDLRDMRVADNGCGMEPEDAVLAFQRHATSKITSAHDLAYLTTLGFRGEALPSIASISKFTCYTRPQGAETGTRIDIKDGTVHTTETGCAFGTVMEISDLFFNVPARLKFLKKPSTEFAHVQEIVQSLALAHPAVVFELRKGDSIVFRTSGSNDLARVAEETKFFSGKESLVMMTQQTISFERSTLSINGILAKPLHFRGDRKAILCIVNNRPVRCPLTYKALEYAFSDLIPRGRHPLAVIRISIDADQIDVNIHPTKKEIKYVESNAVYMALHRTIGDTLRQPRKEIMAEPRHSQPAQLAGAESQGQNTTEWMQLYSRGDQWADDAGSQLIAPHMRPAPAQVHKDVNVEGRAENARARVENEPGSSLLRETPVAYPNLTQVEQLSFNEKLDFKPDLSSSTRMRDESSVFVPREPRSFAHSDPLSPAQGETSSLQDGEPLALPSDTDCTLPLGWRLAGYIHNTYFLFETVSGLEIIEQHIAHERLLYEHILAGQYTPGRISEHVQRLCISAPLDLTAEQADLLKQHQECIERLGFEFAIENDNVSCLKVPLELANQHYAAIIQKMIEDLAAVESASIELEASKSLACQSAIKNGMPLSEPDIIKLVSAWLQTPRNDTCPHGRPVRLRFSKEQFFQMFHPA